MNLHQRSSFFVFVVFAVLTTNICRAQDKGQQQDSLPVLKQLSLEQLMDIEVTSVAKKEQTVRETAAAIYVITEEEIRRSGVRSIPEALRLAPGVNVSRIVSNKWSIGRSRVW
jgi:outer membrane receptor for ferrienterochelin and colicin